jgi:glycosyltransferase involved in cell wall biosynthesis
MITVMSVIDTGGPGGAETVFLHAATRLDPARFRSVAVVSREGWLAERVRENGLEPLVVSASGSFHVGYLRTLMRIARKQKVDVVAAHLYGSAVYCSLAGILAGIPVISILHGQSDVPRAARLSGAKAALVRRGSRKVVFVSDALREDLGTRLRFPTSRSVVIPNGVDTVRFQPGRDRTVRGEIGISDDTILVGAVGNIRRPKAYEVLLQAAHELTARSDRFHFAIAGEIGGTLGAELLQLRQRLGLERRVTFLGLRSDVVTVLRNLDIFALSSRTEGFSIACIEAMACGVPVVATRSGGPEQILENERSGLLVPVDNPAALAAAIERLASTPALADSLRNAASARVQEHFSLQTMLSRYETLLANAAARH